MQNSTSQTETIVEISNESYDRALFATQLGNVVLGDRHIGGDRRQCGNATKTITFNFIRFAKSISQSKEKRKKNAIKIEDANATLMATHSKQGNHCRNENWGQIEDVFLLEPFYLRCALLTPSLNFRHASQPSKKRVLKDCDCSQT